MARGCIFALLLTVLIGCSPQPYRASFEGVIYDQPNQLTISPYVDFPLRDPDSARTMAQAMKSNVFWKVYMVPRLPGTLSQDGRVMRGLSVVPREDRRIEGKLVATFDVVFVDGGKSAFDALVGAYHAFSLDLVQGRLAYAKEQRVAAELSGNEREIIRISKAVEALEKQHVELNASQLPRPAK